MKAELLSAIFDGKQWLMESDALRSYADEIQHLRPEMIGDKMRAAAGAPLMQREDQHTVIRVEGPIVRRHTWYSEWIGACATEEVMQSVYDANKIGKPVIGVISTPGGDAAGVGECADAWASLEVPLVMYTGTQAQSAGMWWYAQGDVHLAHETALLGSIGVRTSYYDMESDSVIVSDNAENKLGTRAEAVRIINDLERLMINSIASGYGIDPEKVKADFGRGGSFVAVDAKERGMVDKFSSFNSIPKMAGDLMKLNAEAIAAIEAAGGLETVLASITGNKTGDTGDGSTTVDVPGTVATTATGTTETAAPAPAVPAPAAPAAPAGVVDAGLVQQMIAEANSRQLKILSHPMAKIDYDLCLEYAQSDMAIDMAVGLLDRTLKAVGPAAAPGGDEGIDGELSGDEQLDSLIAGGADYDDGVNTGGDSQPAASSTAHLGKGRGKFRDMSAVADNPKLLSKNAQVAGSRIAQKMIANGGAVVKRTGE